MTGHNVFVQGEFFYTAIVVKMYGAGSEGVVLLYE